MCPCPYEQRGEHIVFLEPIGEVATREVHCNRNRLPDDHTATMGPLLHFTIPLWTSLLFVGLQNEIVDELDGEDAFLQGGMPKTLEA